MGSFTLTIIDPEKNQTNALKLLTFILYYLYYSTFEEPLNNHLFKQITNTPSEQSSPSLQNTIQQMLLKINQIKRNEDRDRDRDRDGDGNVEINEDYTKIIELLAQDIGDELQTDLFNKLQATKVEIAGRVVRKALRQVSNDIEEDQEKQKAIAERNRQEEISISYEDEINKYDRLIQHEEHMYVLLTLQTIANIINSNNEYLMLIQQHKYKSDDIIKPTFYERFNKRMADAANTATGLYYGTDYMRKEYIVKPIGQGLSSAGNYLQT
jgi:hypothetical protein